MLGVRLWRPWLACLTGKGLRVSAGSSRRARDEEGLLTSAATSDKTALDVMDVALAGRLNVYSVLLDR